MVEGSTFSDLVREAFIDPLRSVLIVDDDYPTWEEILNSAMDTTSQNSDLADRSTKKTWHTAAAGPLAVIAQFRARNPGFIIDIHDAVGPDANGVLGVSETPEDLASHLFQSDLLILDYFLDGDNAGLKGIKARKILQSVLLNRHFNLIVVHTGEPDLEEVFFECLLSVMESCSSQYDETVRQGLEATEEILDDIEGEANFDRKYIHDYFDLAAYIELRRLGLEISLNDLVRQFIKGDGPLADLSQWIQSFGFEKRYLRGFFFWAIHNFEKNRNTMFSNMPIEGLRWSSDYSCMWLRTVRGFVTFVGKGPEDLLKELQKALENWQPTPSRLLSAKYRHELNRVGVEAEDRTLVNSHAFAHFYSDICTASQVGITDGAGGRLAAAKLKDHVSRQSEAISIQIEDEIVKFGIKIVETDKISGNEFATYYGVNLTEPAEAKVAVAHYNSYVSTLPLKQGSDQLDSGHIFKVGGEWWVCATPACDLQPGQVSIAFGGLSTELKPFTALLLKQAEISNLTSGHINSGAYCFVETSSGEIVALGLRLTSDDGKPVNEKVTWRTFLAKGSGLIENNELELLIPRLNAGVLDNETKTAQIIAKLRYEYALNYIQKVGASVSRIGLGYAVI